MSDKLIIVTFSNGHRYSISADLVAKDRAAFYAEIETKDNNDNSSAYDEIFHETYKETMDDDTELYNWMNNNMEWSEVEYEAVRLKDRNNDVDYNTEFTNARKSIIAIEDLGDESKY